MKTHINQKDIPTSITDKRAKIRWIQDHPVWKHKFTIRVPVGNWFTDSVLSMDDHPHEDFTIDDGRLENCATFDMVYVDPSTECIENDDHRNTDFRVWIEAGPWHDMSKDGNMAAPKEGWNDFNRWSPTHDTRLDCGAPTMELALLKLASLVECFYKDDGADRDMFWCDWDLNGSTCVYNSQDFCCNCGFSKND